MKLCYFLPEYSRSTATHHLHMYELLERLSHRFDLTVVTRSNEPEVEMGRARVLLVKSPTGIGRFFEYLGLLLRLHREGCRSFYIHYQILPTLLALLTVRPLGSKLFFWSCVEVLEFFAPWSLSPRHLARKFGVDLPMTVVLRHADMLVTCSAFMKEYFVKGLGVRPERIGWVHLWVNLDRFRRMPERRPEIRAALGLGPDTPVILYAHSLTHHRGVLYLPAILKRVHREVPDAVLLVVGGGPMRAPLAEAIEREGLAEKVRILGPIPNSELPAYFAAADLFINPTDHEAFGRVLLEAMAMGVPFVSTDGGGGILAFTTKAQQRYIVPTRDPEAFGAAMAALLLDPGRRHALMEEGLGHIKSFDLPVAVDRFAELLTHGSAGGGERR